METYEVNDIKLPKGNLTLFNVQLLKNGEFRYSPEKCDYLWKARNKVNDRVSYSITRTYYREETKNVEYLKVIAWAKSETHAVKIAQDLRRKIIASNEWIIEN